MGEWELEPDEKYFKYKNVECLIFRNPESGCLLGYVRIPDCNPLCDFSIDEIDIRVHGGLTFAGTFEAYGNRKKYLGYWIGFDCSHAGDFSPFCRFNRYPGEEYRNMAYVEAQVKGMVEQLLVGVETNRAVVVTKKLKL